MNVTNKKTHWWPWSKQKQSAKPSDQDPNLPANWVVEGESVEYEALATGGDNLTDRIVNLEKLVGQLSASALRADMDKHTKNFLKTDIGAEMAKATGRIDEIKQGMENNNQQIKNIIQELTAKTSNLVTNGRVAKLETEVARKMVGQSNDDLVTKIASLEKAVSQHTTTLEDDLVKKVAKLETEVAKKMVGQSNDILVTEMN